MPVSLRLPTDIELQIAGYSARQGLSKSAVIVRSIQEFLAKHAQPTAFQIYEEVMQDAAKADAAHQHQDARHEAAEQRPVKRQVRQAIRRKHAERSARASLAVSATGATPGDGARRSGRRSA